MVRLKREFKTRRFDLRPVPGEPHRVAAEHEADTIPQALLTAYRNLRYAAPAFVSKVIT
jgi:hypothetical protein